MKKPIIKKKTTQPKKTTVVARKKNPKSVKPEKPESSKKLVYPPWTMLKHLSDKDHKDLKRFFELFISGKIISAFSLASNFDTIVREAIPLDIWKQCGGKLTPKGEAELKNGSGKAKIAPVEPIDPKKDKVAVKEKNQQQKPPQGDNAENKPEPVEIKFKSDKELEQLVTTNSKTIFGEQSLFFKDIKENPDEHFPTEFLIDFSNNEKPKLYLIETVLTDQNFGQYFVRITHFFALLRNKKDQNNLVWKLREIISTNKKQEKELQSKIQAEIEISEFLLTLLDNHPFVLLVTDGEKNHLPILIETYTETWGKMLKTLVIRKYLKEDDEESHHVNPAFSDILKNGKNKPEIVKCTEKDHLNATSEISRNIYSEIKRELLKIDSSIEFNAKKIYISVRKKKNLAFFHLRKKISLVVMNPEVDTRKLIKHHEIKSLPESVQKFWNGECCTIVIEKSSNLIEIINLLKKMIARA